jgi:hypothetical protein
MSDQSENAATQQVIDSFKTASDAKAELEGKMKALGKRLSAFAKTLQDPNSYVFYIDNTDNISVGQRSVEPRPAVARVTPSEINWQDLCETLRGYNQATGDKKHSSAQLRAMGLPIAE